MVPYMRASSFPTPVLGSLRWPWRWAVGLLAAAMVVVLLPQSAAASDPEPNNSPAQATAVRIDLSGRTGALSSSSDVDYYTFVAVNSGVHTVEMFNADASLDGACLSSYDSGQTRTGESCVGSGLTVSRLEINVNAGQRAWVRVAHTLGRTGNYSLRVLPPPAQMSWSPDSEPNNSLSTASPLASARWSIQTLYSLPSQYAQEGSDVDVFRIDTVPGQQYSISTTNLAGSLKRDLQLRLYAPNGSLVEQPSTCAATGTDCHNRTVKAPGSVLYALVTAATSTDLQGQYWICARPAGAGCTYGEVNQFGDLNSDGTPDVLAVHDDGTLQLYATLGPTVSAPTPVGQGWNNFQWLSLVPDMNGDGRTDLVGLRNDGTLWTYQGTGNGRFGDASQAGKGWGSMTLMTVLNDITGDGRPDMVAVNGDGYLVRYSFGASAGFLTDARVIGRNWGGIRLTASVDDFSGDGIPDLLAVAEHGDLIRYAFNSGGLITSAAKVGQHWDSMGLVTAPGDINNDKRRDLVSLRNDGTLWAYWNNGTTWGGPAQLTTGLSGIRLLA